MSENEQPDGSEPTYVRKPPALPPTTGPAPSSPPPSSPPPSSPPPSSAPPSSAPAFPPPTGSPAGGGYTPPTYGAPSYPPPAAPVAGGGWAGTGPSSWSSGAMPPASPPGRNKGLLIGLVVAALLAVTGLVGGGVVVWQNRDDDSSETASDPDASHSDSPSDTPSTSPSPSEEPTEDVPTPSEPPTEEPAPPAAGEGFTFSEFSGDWNFRIDDVALQASFVRGWDYDACSEISVDGSMGDIGCQKSSELSFRGLGGRAAFSHVIMTMKSPAAAKRAIDKSLITGSNWSPQKEAFLEGGSGGTFVAKHVGTFVVISVETHLPDVPDERAAKFLNYMNADFSGALSFR